MSNENHNPDGTFAGNSIHAVYDALNREVNRIDQLREADQAAVAAALISADKATQAAFKAAQEAVSKAEINQQRVNEGQNEFRQQLKDQAATLMPREEYRLQHEALNEKADKNAQDINDLRVLITQGPSTLPGIKTAVDVETGRRIGALDTRTLVFGIIALVWPIVAFIILNGVLK